MFDICSLHVACGMMCRCIVMGIIYMLLNLCSYALLFKWDESLLNLLNGNDGILILITNIFAVTLSTVVC